jgi:hypothetical protein
MSRLITPTFLNSIKWYKNCPPTWKEKARADLENQLKRIWTEPSKPIKLGIEFEKKVYEQMKKHNEVGSESFKKVVSLCQGGKVQEVIKRDIEVNGKDYCLYGKADVLKDDYIIDIKTTGNYKEKTYTGSYQHILYMYAAQMTKFQYVIAEWEEAPKIKDIHIINLETMRLSIYEKKIKTAISDAMDFLKKENLIDHYLNTFCYKK